jgi:CheY-like chemotaxis protein
MRVHGGRFWCASQYVIVTAQHIVIRMEKRDRPNRYILIVEDDQRDAELLTELLRECECEIVVDIATDAEDGLAKILRGRFDLIICDYCLPGMDGLSFVKIVKQTKGNIPILILTGYPQQELEAQFIRHGACTYLSKDVDPRILANFVKEALAPLPAWLT